MGDTFSRALNSHQAYFGHSWASRWDQRAWMMAFPSPYTTCALKKQLCKTPEPALQVQSSVAQRFKPLLGEGTCPTSIASTLPELTHLPPPHAKTGSRALGQACSSALNHCLWSRPPSAETSSKIRTSPPGTISSHDPECPLREGRKDKLDVMTLRQREERSWELVQGAEKGWHQQ